MVRLLKCKLIVKKVLKILRETDPEQEEFIVAIAEKTDNFTNISKEACEQLILKVGEMIEASNQKHHKKEGFSSLKE